MLRTKLDTRTISAVKLRADYFFAEQVKRLGPLPGAHIEVCPPVPVLAAPRKRGRPRKTLTT